MEETVSNRRHPIRRFLQETWEMFYWALWCPSKLQQRMNEWSPQPEKDEKRPNTNFSDILLSSFNLRFFCQFLLLILILDLPLLFVLKSVQGLVLVLTTFLVVYGLAFWCLRWSISLPILTSIIYIDSPSQLIDKLESAWQNYTGTLPPLPQIAFGVSVLALILGVTSSSIYTLIQKQRVNLAQSLFVLGSVLGAGLGSWLVIQNLWITCLVTAVAGFLSVILRNMHNSSDDDDAFGVAVGMVVGVAFVVVGVVAFGAAFSATFGAASVVVGVVSFAVVFGAAFVVSLVAAFGAVLGVFAIVGVVFSAFVGAGGVAGVVVFSVGYGVAGVVVFGVVGVVAIVITGTVVGIVVGVASLPIFNFLTCAWIISVCVAARQNRWIGIVVTAGTLVSLGFERLGMSALLAISVVFLGYSHTFPDYLVFAASSLTAVRSRFLPWQLDPLSSLKRLPPYASEYLWFPLPNHDRLLTQAFQANPAEALAIFQNIQSQPLRGFRLTIDRALPQIVADQFGAARDCQSLTQTALSNHPILPFLVPQFYLPETGASKSSKQLDLIVPQLQDLATDVSKALEGSVSAIRERGLENVLTKLDRLSEQLPGLGLNQPQIQRWRPVLDRWRTILELELAEQQKLSQGELLNPFQFGNPLRRDRADLFKGRTKFSEQILRLVLDRNRPTLVLHGARRSGKSSFLLNLPRLLPSDLIPIYLDLQRQGTTNSDADFLYSLAKAIRDDCRAQGIRLPTLPDRPTFYQNPYPLLEDWLDDAFENFSDRRILLNLDEFEKIGEAIAQGRITLRLFDELRSLIQHSNQLAFLFSGVQTLDELGPNWSSYFISIVPIEMSYLELHEAEQLLTDPDPEFELGYAPGIVDEILTLTHCQPYLLQLIGWTLVNQANLRQVRVVDRSLLQTAIQDSFTQGEPYFTNLWTEFTGTTPSERAAGQAALIAIAQNQPIPNLNAPATQAALTRLHRYHILKNNAFEVPLVEQWVRDRAITTELQ